MRETKLVLDFAQATRDVEATRCLSMLIECHPNENAFVLLGLRDIERWYALEPCLLSRPPPSLAVTELEKAVLSAPHMDRLQNAEDANRIRQPFQGSVVVDLSVLGIGSNLAERNRHHLGAVT
jgi:hypothetical protein